MSERTMKIKLFSVLLLIVGFTINGSALHAANNKDNLKGAKWVAQQDLTYPARKSTVYVQDGSIVTKAKNGDRYHAYCAVVSNKKKDQALTIIKNSVFQIVNMQYDSIAHNDYTYVYKTIMKVTSEKHPAVTSIECGFFGDQTEKYLTVQEMQKTMTGVFTLEMK